MAAQPPTSTATPAPVSACRPKKNITWSKLSTAAPASARRTNRRSPSQAREPLVQQDDEDAVEEQDRRAQTISPPISSRKPKSAPRPGTSAPAVVAHQEAEREQQHIADEQAVDRLPHHHRVLADVDQQQHHQLAGEQHARAGRGDDAERQRDVEDAGEVGLEEMHHPERAEEGADAEPRPRAKQRRSTAK